MENNKKRLSNFFYKHKKKLIIFFSAIFLFVTVIILFISPITKYLIEKYDEKYTGRQITMDWAYVNPFTGYVHFKNLKIYEYKSDSIFFSSKGLSINIEMHKLLSETYEISELSLNHPKGMLIQIGKGFNYDDLIEKFSPKKSIDTNTTSPVHFSILSVVIDNGEFYFQDKTIPINYFIKNVKFESTGMQWNADTIAGKFSFESGIGTGDMKGDFTINIKNLDYRFAAIANKFDLNIITQYVKDFMNYGTLSANFDADIKATGNFKDEEQITTKGRFAINDFHFGKNKNEDYAAFEKLVVAINELSPKAHKYLFDSISLNRPYIKYELYDHLDNIQEIFGTKGGNVSAANADPAKFNLVIEIANYIKVLSKNFFKSNYKINKLAIYNGNIKYNDYSISEKFSADLNPLFFNADSIDKNHSRVNATFTSGIKPYGNMSVSLSINPKDSSDFDMRYELQKLPLPMFNPYTISYTSFPLDRGTLGLNGIWNVRDGNIQSINHLLIIDPRVSKRIKNKDTKWIPLPLVMSFLRERGNVIDYEIPITGNLKNPKFVIKDVIIDVVKNIFVKPLTTPYRMQVKYVESEIEKSLTLKWQMRQNIIRSSQEKFIEHMADFLVKNPTATIHVYPQYYATKEKEYILFFEAKKKYFLIVNNKNAASFSKNDSEKVEKMSVKDTMFVKYLNSKLKNSLIFTIQEKCTQIIDSSIVNAKFDRLNKDRTIEFISYFKEKEVEKRVKIYNGETLIPYYGFSFYKIAYKGEFPESIVNAYKEMNTLNDEAPRKEFKKERKKDGSILYENSIKVNSSSK